MVCHSVQPGEHQTGPSLTHVWNRKAGTTPGVGKCSAAEFYCFSNSSGTHMRDAGRSTVVVSVGKTFWRSGRAARLGAPSSLRLPGALTCFQLRYTRFELGELRLRALEKLFLHLEILS